MGSIFGGGLSAQQLAHAQQQQQQQQSAAAAAAYMQQQQQQHLRQQHQNQQLQEQGQQLQSRPDMSEFPSLGSPPGLTNMAQQQLAGQLYRTIAGARLDRPQEQLQRPGLTSDDFPALSKSAEPGGAMALGAGVPGAVSLAPGARIADQAQARASGSEQRAGLANGLETTSAYRPPTANVAKAAGSAGAQQPVAAADRFGMLGILATNDYGFDVSKFGLSLPASGALYPTFGSPWTDQTQAYGLVEPDFRLPGCYNASNPPAAVTKIPSVTDETLFYVFYTMPRSELQLAAAEELYQRQWRYHKELRLWLTKDPETQPTVRTARGEQGVFIFFDPGIWQRVKKEFLVLYELLEDQGALSANAEAAGAAAAARGGAQSVPPPSQQQQQQFRPQAQQQPPLPLPMALGAGGLDQTQFQSLLRLGTSSAPQQQAQQQEGLQGVSGAYHTAVAAAHSAGMPPHMEIQATSAAAAAQSSSIAEDVAAASLA
ncbi:transcriptional regulator [Coemansia biformis]|uniref:Transcriptional regulator n=1 Tax=Coemansia biformis TaxID=1286918 RepID=A0A9W8D0H9_9FUNG|nr:transcriptional regulator [Coemansia biformis]